MNSRPPKEVCRYDVMYVSIRYHHFLQKSKHQRNVQHNDGHPGKLDGSGGGVANDTCVVIRSSSIEIESIMPSRKKAKGKARKAAKEAKAVKAEERRAVAAVNNQRQEESVEAQMQQLVISALSPELCRHGFPHYSLSPSLSPGDIKICTEFINAYIDAFFSPDKKGFTDAYNATEEEYADVYDSKLDTVVSMLLAGGTLCILQGNNRDAHLYASLASYFEEYIEVCHRETKVVGHLSKTCELLSADRHTLISYYKKRIPCSCLDEKYKEVKSVKKMGLCRNPNCSLPDNGRVERSKMFSCARCGYVNYCSVECQKANWKVHKKFCDKNAKLKAAFDSDQS